MVRDVHHRLGGLAIAGIALLVLAIVLVAIGFTVPWWASFANGTMTSWYLGDRCTGGTCTDYSASPSLQSVFGLTNLLVVAAGLLLMVAVVAFAASLVWPRMGSLGLVLGAVAALLILLAPVYLYFGLPGALTSSGFPVPVAGFFGSYAGGGSSYSWTGAASWFLAWLIVPIVAAGTAAATVSARRHVAEEQALESLSGLAPHAADVPTTMPEPLPEEPPMDRFCPVCGLRYPDTVDFCKKDSAPLKDLLP